LQLAAKQVREMKSANKPATAKASSIDNAMATDASDYSHEIAALTAENITLKEQIAELTRALEAARSSH
jgi:hypothetical protein